jgi:hypothetical protein
VFFFPIVPDKNCGKPAGSSGSGVFFSASSSGIEFRVPIEEGECTTDNIVFTDADPPPCYTHADCVNYKPQNAGLGTPCCLRDRCFCGIDANANPNGACYDDPSAPAKFENGIFEAGRASQPEGPLGPLSEGPLGPLSRKGLSQPQHVVLLYFSILGPTK